MKEKNSIKFETLHKKIDIKTILFIISLLVIVILVIVNRVSHARFTSSLNMPFVRGKINYKHPDFKMVSMHVQESTGSSTYNETTIMPSGNDYIINSSKSYCTKGVQGEKDTGVILKTVNGNHVMNNLTKNDRCFLYFDKANNVASILAKYTKDDSRKEEITVAFKESTPTTVYSKADDFGTSYAFAGVNPNNWVKIGSMYFRIIRFNGNGSMRLIYSGSDAAKMNGTGTEIGKKAFNENENDNVYVGLQYTIGQVHGTGTNSTILGEVNSTDETTLYGWYNSNIKNIYGSLIDSTVGFCSDRESFTDTSGTTAGGGIGTTLTYYRGYIKYVKAGDLPITFIPTLKCKEKSDLLKLPVGLITIDEYMLAGGGNLHDLTNLTYKNTDVWLHTGEIYWTMSPCSGGDYARVFCAHSKGYFTMLHVVDSWGVRPVINLKSTATFEANGTGEANNPYILKIN